MKIERRFTVPGVDPLDAIDWERRDSVIREPDGSVVFEMRGLEVPASWSQVATDILAQKYFRKAGVPQPDGSLGAETSARQVVRRLAGCWTDWARRYRYFDSDEDAAAFDAEITHMLINQMASPNSPQWFNTGLAYAYGIKGTPQGHYYVDPDTQELKRSEDAYSRIQAQACLPGHAVVNTPDGPTPIREIVRRDLRGLEVYDAYGTTRVVATKHNGIKPVYRIKLANGNYIETTADHLVLAAGPGGHRPQWLAAGALKAGMRVFQRTDTSIQLSGDKLAEAEAALAGWLQADGFVGQYNYRTNGSLTIEAMTVNDDEADFVSALISAVLPGVHCHERVSSAKKNPALTIRRHRLYGEKLRPFVRSYDLLARGVDMEVPEAVTAGGKNVATAYLRALFQGDAGVRLRRDSHASDIVFASISPKLADGASKLLYNLGVYHRVARFDDPRGARKPCYYLVVAYNSAKRVFQDQIGFVSQDKREKLASAIARPGKAVRRLRRERIESIEYVGDMDVYDIQTESSSFLTNNVVVHNCFIQRVEDDLVNDGGIMDLWVREARIFKQGSGTGTNFSNLRAEGERLAGGGTSSGLMSFLRVGDRAAGAIKSGGTTRRAAKMVILDMDHPDIEKFINWKVDEEKKVAALIAAGYDGSYEGEAYQTVSGQNSNNSVRVPNKFVDVVRNDGTWDLTWRTTGTVAKTVRARALWDQVAAAAWSCADPGVQYDDIINEWHTCPAGGRIRATNPCSEYVFLDSTSCNLASINLMKFYDASTNQFDVEGYRHAIRLWTTVLEISVLMAHLPSPDIARGTYDYRTLGLGYANLGTMLMVSGIPYDSPRALALTGALTAILTGEAYATSAELAGQLGPFARYKDNADNMLRVIRNHRRAAYNVPADEYEGLSVIPMGIDANLCPPYLLAGARDAWDRALKLGEKHGFRNAQVSVLAPTGTISLQMDCDTTGIEPDFALVKFKKLAGGGYFKIINQSIPAALRNLGYTPTQVDDIVRYARGTGSLYGAPYINGETLKARGFADADLAKVEAGLAAAFEIGFAFNQWTLGDAAMQRLGFKPEQYNALGFDLLKELGFTRDEIEAANNYICGTMTVEGAPHLKAEHYAVFDCANKCGKLGKRFIHHMGHVRMLAASQPFISGSTSKTINMPHEVTVEDIQEAYMRSWDLGVKCIAIYRDGSKLSQPLSNKGTDKTATTQDDRQLALSEELERLAEKAKRTSEELQPDEILAAAQRILANATNTEFKRQVAKVLERNRLPAKRRGWTQKAKIAGHTVFLRTGEYGDGTLGEIFVDLHKEGASFRSLMNCFAIAVSIGLQYGVPLEEFVDKFVFTRFEPNGFVDHPNIKHCTSIVDYIFRVLGFEYLGRTDFVQVKPEDKGIDHVNHDDMAQAEFEARVAEQQAVDAETPSKPVIQRAAPQAVTAVAPQKTVDATTAAQTAALRSREAQMAAMMGDAPLCDVCGAITRRNGTCYVCDSCGRSMGCS